MRSWDKSGVNNVAYYEYDGYDYGIIPTKKEIVQQSVPLSPDKGGKSAKKMQKKFLANR